MTVNNEINNVARKIQEEVNTEVNLSIGSIENTAQAVPTLCERMDNICSMMAYQSEIITNAETHLEEAKYQYKRKELIAKQTYNQAFVNFKQEDRLKSKNEKRTDKEVDAMASLEASIPTNEALSSEMVYLKAQHTLEDEKHKYEILNNHFLSYRKACDMLMTELKSFTGIRNV